MAKKRSKGKTRRWKRKLETTPEITELIQIYEELKTKNKRDDSIVTKLKNLASMGGWSDQFIDLLLL